MRLLTLPSSNVLCWRAVLLLVTAPFPGAFLLPILSYHNPPSSSPKRSFLRDGTSCVLEAAAGLGPPSTSWSRKAHGSSNGQWANGQGLDDFSHSRRAGG